MLPNIAAFPLAMMGILRAGAAQVNVNPLYTPRELEHQLNDAAPRSSSSSAASPRRSPRSSQDFDQVRDQRRPWRRQAAAIPGPAVDARLTNAVRFSDALAQRRRFAVHAVALSGDDLLFLQYTAATTGVCKGAALAHRNLIANNRAVQGLHGLSRLPREKSW